MSRESASIRAGGVGCRSSKRSTPEATASVASIMRAAYSPCPGQSNHGWAGRGAESAFRRVWFIPLWLGQTAGTLRDGGPLVVKIETLRIVLPLVVGLLIPLFYLGVYLASACQRLRSLQERSFRSRSNLLGKLEEHLGAVRASLDSSAGPPAACESAAAVRRSLDALRRLVGEAGDADERPEGESLASALGELERALET